MANFPNTLNFTISGLVLEGSILSELNGAF